MSTIQRVNGVKDGVVLSCHFLFSPFGISLELEGWRDQMISMWCLWCLWKLSSEWKLIKALRAEYHGQAQPYWFLYPLTCHESHPAGNMEWDMNWAENCKLGLKFKDSWGVTSCGVFALGKDSESVCNKVVLGQFYLQCTPALPSKMAALSLDSRLTFS